LRSGGVAVLRDGDATTGICLGSVVSGVYSFSPVIAEPSA
tara:strand:+ start:359 stop:478 length:120 start_codon:yes stop_codon:yes gene_type:complete